MKRLFVAACVAVLAAAFPVTPGSAVTHTAATTAEPATDDGPTTIVPDGRRAEPKAASFTFIADRDYADVSWAVVRERGDRTVHFERLGALKAGTPVTLTWRGTATFNPNPLTGPYASAARYRVEMYEGIESTPAAVLGRVQVVRRTGIRVQNAMARTRRINPQRITVTHSREAVTVTTTYARPALRLSALRSVGAILQFDGTHRAYFVYFHKESKWRRPVLLDGVRNSDARARDVRCKKARATVRRSRVQIVVPRSCLRKHRSASVRADSLISARRGRVATTMDWGVTGRATIPETARTPVVLP